MTGTSCNCKKRSTTSPNGGSSEAVAEARPTEYGNFGRPEDWVTIPVRRSINAIEPLLSLCDRHGGRIMGGYARYVCSPRPRPAAAGDVDLFPVGDNSPDEVFDALYRGLLYLGFVAAEECKFCVYFENPGSSKLVNLPDVQLVKPFREALRPEDRSVRAVLGSFDFSVTRVALNADRATAIAHRTFLADEQALRLRVMSPACPVSTMRRAMRYAARGYTLSRREAVKLFLDWEARPPGFRSDLLKEVGLLAGLGADVKI